jgi:pimeloyl-ACP methyl ester carboxylesterase
MAAMSPTLVSAVTADGVSLAVSIHGQGGASLLLIPGLGATRIVFDPLLPALLARGMRVIVFDPRGTGDSEPGSRPLTMLLLAGDAASVLDAADSPTADVMGASMGGVVAQHLVVDRPERVRRLVLAATAPGGAEAVPADPRATDALLGKGARTPADAYRLACTVLYSAHFQRTHPAFIEAQVHLRAARPLHARVFSAQLAALRGDAGTLDRLATVRSPTLVLHGTDDAVTPIENARLLAARIPGARTRWFDGCGHLFFHERPDEAARVVDEFLQS